MTRLGLANSDRGCAAVRWAVTHLHLHATVLPGSGDSTKCSLGLRADDEKDVATQNRALAAETMPIFERNGFTLDLESCVPYRAGIGKGVVIYQWCRLAQL
jgi:hypothetical protein